MVGLGPWSSPPPEAEQRYAALVGAAADGRRRPGLRRHPVADRGRPRGGAHPPRGAATCWSTWPTQVRAVAVITGRPARQALALGGLDEVGNAIGEPARSCYVLRPVRQRALVLHQPPGGLAAAAARAGDVPARAAAAAAARRTPATPTSRTRGWRSPCTPGGWRTREAAFERLLPVLGDLGRPARPGGRARPQRDRGPLARHAQGRRGRSTLVEESSGRRRSCSPATTSATSRRSRRSPSCATQGMPTLLVCSAVRRGERARSSSPTSSSTAPTACSTCSASSPATRAASLRVGRP